MSENEGNTTGRGASLTRREDIKAWLVGGGIASLAAAVFLIRDAGLPGGNIAVLEEGELAGGSLDGTGTPDAGYVIRGGRMFTDDAYTCTYDLLSSIPSLTGSGRTVRDEIRVFNEENRSHARSRLVRAGEKVDVSTFGLSNRDRLDLIELVSLSEESLGAKRIEDYFAPAFFRTNFWYMWATTFAFQPWHSLVECKRYLQRFIQEFPRMATLAGVRRTPFNQYDSIILPVVTWLKSRGVRVLTDTVVTDLDFRHGPGGEGVERIHCMRDGVQSQMAVEPHDLVFVTNGSMTAGSRLGSMTSAPDTGTWTEGGAWSLWETLAKKHSGFGNPAVFDGRIDESKWMSFTVTLRDPRFFASMEAFTGNEAGTGGLVTFTDSNWLMSVVLAHQPHFINQPADVQVFWGYGLFLDEEGNYVRKKMSACSGADMLVELEGHLPFDARAALSPETTRCIPCMMPFITSQFMPRVKGDRPLVRPAGTTNIAFIGQFCEMPDDVVFTVEYSVRSAQTAVYSLLGVEREVPPVYRGLHDPRVLLAALKALLS